MNITALDTLDKQLLLTLNSWHTAYLDQAMWLVSGRWAWLLVFIAFLWTLKGKGWKQAILTVLAVAVAVLIADQVSSGLIKHAVERLRPTHEPALSGLVHVVNGYTGGKYGFVSSHAANAFAVALLLALMLRHRAAMWMLMLWAVLQCYSRVYLGVHYPGDILGGTVVGLIAAWLVYWLWLKVSQRWTGTAEPVFSKNDGALIAHAVGVTIVVIAVAACVI